MNSITGSTLTLSNRPLATRVISLLLFAASCWLLYFNFSPAYANVTVFTLSLFAVSFLAYGFARSSYPDEKVSPTLSAALVTAAAIIMSALHGKYSCHYSVMLALALAATYKSRSVMAVAATAAIVEQFVIGIFYHDIIFPASLSSSEDWMLSHYLWVVLTGVVLMFSCESSRSSSTASTVVAAPALTAPAAPKVPTEAELTTTYMVLPKVAAKASAETSGGFPALNLENVPADLEELVKAASEVGKRAQKLHRSISNIEGPLKRMVQSINGANRGMQEIKDELSRTAASVIQITQSSEMHANKAQDVFTAAEEAAYGSQIGALSTEQTIRNMDRIRDQMDSIEARMENLLNKSQLMVQVVGFADELALQSKVLSVNAAIEAAKAGDRGHGFAAVAREVKSLANQSKDATRQVRQILKEIQKSIAEVRRSIALGNETVNLASDQCQSTVDSIRGLDNSVSSSRDAAEAIMNSSKDQVNGIMLISHAMNDIQIVSEQNSSSLANLQVEAQKLNTITKELVNEMSGYQALIEKLMAQCAALSQSDSGS